MSTKDKNKHNLDMIAERFTSHVDERENVYLSDKKKENLKVFPLHSKNCTALIRNYFRTLNIRLSRENLKDLLNEIEAEALYSENDLIQPKNRIARYGDILVIDMGDEKNTRVVFQKGAYSLEKSGIDIPFMPSPTAQPYCFPDSMSIIDLFFDLFNLSLEDSQLLLAWVTYILSNSKEDFVSYPILVIKALQGTGKTSLCKILRRLIDPRSSGVQKMPSKIEDIAAMAASAHLVIFDNVRSLTLDMADNLCLTSTGGTGSKRKLYSNNDESVFNLHVPVILNGIHPFIDQSDLAERCLGFNLPPIPSDSRKSEQDLSQEFESGLPRLMAGIFELIAKTLEKLPESHVIYPERMMGFCQWLSATELALPDCNTYCYRNVKVGDIQKHYSANLKNAAFDNLNENEFSAAILEFAQEHMMWSGSPTHLFKLLTDSFSDDYAKSKFWPNTAIAMSKKLKPLITALSTQGVLVEFTRGSTRKISIQYIES